METTTKKKTRVTNAQLKKEVDAQDAVISSLLAANEELTNQVAALQEALLRVVGQWDIQMQQLSGAVQEIALRINTLTAGIEAEPVED